MQRALAASWVIILNSVTKPKFPEKPPGGDRRAYALALAQHFTVSPCLDFLACVRGHSGDRDLWRHTDLDLILALLARQVKSPVRALLVPGSIPGSIPLLTLKIFIFYLCFLQRKTLTVCTKFFFN